MFDSIIHQIFDTYLDNKFDDIRPLFQEDWQEEYEELVKFENKHQFLDTDRTYLECDIINAINYKSELKGFTNGFKLAARLLSEISDKPQISEKKFFTEFNKQTTDNQFNKEQGEKCRLNLTDDLNALSSVMCNAKSVADFTALRIEDIDTDTFDNSQRNQLLYAVEAISRILLIADDNINILANHYEKEKSEKFKSIIFNNLQRVE